MERAHSDAHGDLPSSPTAYPWAAGRCAEVAEGSGHQESAKQVNRSDGFPPDIGRREMAGMVLGPDAYLQAAVAQRRWRP